MLLTISGQPCLAGQDLTIYQSVISRSFIRAANFDNWHSDLIVATVNFGLSNFGYTLPLDFIVLDDLAGYNVIFGVEFQQQCQASDDLACIGPSPVCPISAREDFTMLFQIFFTYTPINFFKIKYSPSASTPFTSTLSFKMLPSQTEIALRLVKSYMVNVSNFLLLKLRSDTALSVELDIASKSPFNITTIAHASLGTCANEDQASSEDTYSD
ncbi:hypothetical protein EV368DRAFT_85643 [Lentinula lateritia]|nr:hypothetical protein EV368DRAFT_85643 [Lentinula lateritia]